jgi:tetratricopeptide (TPR) repeat protein
MSKDAWLGLGFFALMAAGGAFLVWLNWRKIGREEALTAQKNQVLALARSVAVARSRLEQARVEQDPAKRGQFARQAVDGYTQALAVDPNEALYWGERAEAHALLGNLDAAKRDLAKAKELRPGEDWSALEKKCGP